MSGFAISANTAHAQITISTCHINIWVLESFTCNPIFYFDVGLEICNLPSKEKGRPEISLHLPFCYTERISLEGKLRDAETAEVVFAEDVNIVSDPVQLELSGGRKKLFLNSSSYKVTETQFKETNSSIVTINLDNLPDLNYVKSEFHYIRMRFITKNLGTQWQNRRSWMRANGATIDSRFYDLRNWTKHTSDRPSNDEVVNLDRLLVFVIAPSDFGVSAHSPSFKYLRTLENGAWVHYLGRNPGRSNKSRFCVYYWKFDNRDIGKPISRSNPQSVFMSLTRLDPFLRPWNMLRIVIVIVPIFYLLTAELNWDNIGSNSILFLKNFWGWILTLGAVSYLLPHSAWIREKSTKLYASLENSFFRKPR